MDNFGQILFRSGTYNILFLTACEKCGHHFLQRNEHTSGKLCATACHVTHHWLTTFRDDHTSGSLPLGLVWLSVLRFISVANGISKTTVHNRKMHHLENTIFSFNNLHKRADWLLVAASRMQSEMQTSRIPAGQWGPWTIAPSWTCHKSQLSLMLEVWQWSSYITKDKIKTSNFLSNITLCSKKFNEHLCCRQWRLTKAGWHSE